METVLDKTKKKIIEQIVKLSEDQIQLLEDYLNELANTSKESESTTDDKNYDFFASAGLWQNRQIDINQLRSKAWRRN